MNSYPRNPKYDFPEELVSGNKEYTFKLKGKNRDGQAVYDMIDNKTGETVGSEYSFSDNIGLKRIAYSVERPIELEEIKEFFSNTVDMAELEFELKRIKKENPGKKVTYFFTKDDPKGYKIQIKEFFSKPLEDGFTSGKQMINIKLKNYPKAVAKVNQLIDMIGEDRFTIEMAEWIWDFFNNASFERPVNEATKEEETKFHKKLDTLVHNTFGKRKGEMEEVVNYSPEGKDKIYSLISQALQQGKLTKDAQAVFMKWMADPNSTEEAIIKALESIIGGGNVKEGMGNEVGDKISKYIDVEIQSDGDEFPRIDKESISSYLKSIVDPKQISSVDKFINDEKGFDEVAPYFFIDSPEDEDFKKIPNREIERWAKQELSHYIFGDWKNKSLYINEETLTEANVPSNIKEFAKRKGISSLVNKVAGWAEKVGARITGGTAIGKNYDTLILDMGYQTADIYINIEDGTIELYGEPADSFPQFQKVFMDKATRDENQFRREQDLKETLVKRVMEKLSKL